MQAILRQKYAPVTEQSQGINKSVFSSHVLFNIVIANQRVSNSNFHIMGGMSYTNLKILTSPCIPLGPELQFSV